MAATDNPTLVDLVDAANTQQITVESLAQLQHGVPTGVHPVIGRANPIVTSDVAKGSTFELVFVTLDIPARDKARATLGAGQPVLLQTPVEQGVGELYFMVLGYSEQRASRIALEPVRRFSVQAQEIDEPTPP